jgi:hypothetical protein
MDYRATVINSLTAGYPEVANVPVYFDTDREVVDAALAIMGTRPAAAARVMRIRNTLCLEEIEVSEPCLDEPRGNPFSPVGASRPFAFEGDGNLPAL